MVQVRRRVAQATGMRLLPDVRAGRSGRWGRRGGAVGTVGPSGRTVSRPQAPGALDGWRRAWRRACPGGRHEFRLGTY
ncbi:hypothetical protein GCM10010495_25890 [Kitasatospora herbaricolor]|nr:hypothetical protein GCM10010495_25890 [Kitasatospora herbaricolor]